jgi:cytochrome b
MLELTQELNDMNTAPIVKVWDPMVRIFHWTLVGSFIVAYLTEDDFLNLHLLAGYTVLALIMFRIVWGFVGTPYARFSSFVFSPRVVKQYFVETLKLRAKRYVGHNPAGGAMIILLLISLVITVITGVAVYGAEENAGPLAFWLGHAGGFWEEALEAIHEFFANFTLFLVFIHLAGVVVESFIHRENLVGAMFNGRKRAESR